MLYFIGSAENPEPRYNVASGQRVAAVRSDGGGRHFAMIRWGLNSFVGEGTEHRLPAHQRQIGDGSCEAVVPRRLAPGDGFYEWTGD